MVAGSGAHDRDLWSSQRTFVLAAIGSAIGLGNIWRFPYICYGNGGGAFLIAFVVALFTAGIPLLILEFGLGHSTQGAAPKAMRKIAPKMEWFGWLAVGLGFTITVYYAIIMSYCVNFTVFSFNLAWGSNPETFFYNDVVGLTDATQEPWSLGSFMPGIFIGLVVSWIAIILSVWKGTKTVGKVVYFTVLIPWALLLVFVWRGMTLPGADVGLRFYLTPVFSKLLEPSVWLAAYTQVFFSLSVGFAIMIAYSSFLPPKSDLVKNAFVIGIADAATAIVGGLAVFGALGHLAHIKGLPVEDVVLSGPGLTFVSYPEIINALPMAPLFGVLFFLMLLTLAIDSAFSMLEAVASAVIDKWGWSHKRTNLTVGGAAFLLGIPLTFGVGLHWLDIVDRFMNQMGLAIVVLGECLLIGYYYRAYRMREYVNKISVFSIGVWWDICIMIITPAAILWLLGAEIRARWQLPYGDSGLRSQEFIFGWLVIILLFVGGIVFAKLRGAKERE